jgi:NTE family protein
MINILTEQNVRQSLLALTPQDVLITPQLGKLTAGDFAKTRELIDLGEQGALPELGRLSALSLSESAYAQWRANHAQQPAAKTRLAEVGFQGSEYTFPDRYASQLESKVGDDFDEGKAERDARRLAASGDYTRADFKLVTTPKGDGLVFDLEDKPWGPHYFRVGLDMSTDFRGDSRFNIKISHNRHWLDANGTEWRNRIQIGDVPLAFTELYHPLKWTGGISNDWFVAGYAQVERRVFKVYNNDSGDEQGSYLQTQGQVGLDLGQLWGEFGQLRLGVTSQVLRSSPKILAATFTGPQKSVTVVESGVRFAAVVDQLDFANFPQRGYRVQGEAVVGQDREVGNTDGNPNIGPASFNRLEARATAVRTWGAHTLNAYFRAQHLGGKAASDLGRFTLGGFHDLSGYKLGQLDGNDVLFGRLTYYRRLTEVPLFTRGLFIGGTVEAGNAWRQTSAVSASDLRSGFSFFLGADTGLGPVYLGLTHAPKGSTGLYFLVGKP